MTETTTSETPSASVRRRSVAAAVVTMIAVGIALALTADERQPEDSVGDSRTDVIFRPHGWADEATCADCHEQAEHFDQTGHARTLTRAHLSASAELLERLTDSVSGSQEGVSVFVENDDLWLSRTTDSATVTSRVGWCMGSGTHAKTWVSVVPDAMGASDLLEFRWTWFRGTQEFAVTPGHPDATPPTGIGCLGLQFDGPRAVRCFSCHATRLGDRQDRVDENNLVAGVRCQRCHGPRAEHVRSEGQVIDPAWKFEDRDESVRRCGQCHRNPDEFTADELRPDNRLLPRFQPVGLTQSLCYIQSEMSCSTCHNPHLPLSMQDSLGDWQCTQCHSVDHSLPSPCSADQRSDCVGCHMPKVDQPDAPLQFTDHWIRIIKDEN